MSGMVHEENLRAGAADYGKQEAPGSKGFGSPPRAGRNIWARHPVFWLGPAPAIMVSPGTFGLQGR